MDSERFEIVYVEEYGTGVVRQRHAHFSVVEFHSSGHSWRVLIDNDDLEMIDDISIGHEEIQ